MAHSSDRNAINGLSHVDHKHTKAFDIDVVCESLEKCIEDKNAIDLSQYLRGFTELLRFFNILGAVFIFVSKDVESKINILKEYLNESDNGFNYTTVQKMIGYEKGNNLLSLSLSTRPSGARTLLRLHRALEFVSQFMFEVSRLDEDKGTADAARRCYKKTLSKHHPWLIQKSASLAMYTLPYKKHLIEKAYCGSVPDNETRLSIADSMNRLAILAEEVFSAMQKLYEEQNLLELA